MHASTLKRTEHLAAFLKIFGAREPIQVHDDDCVKMSLRRVVNQARERSTLREKAFRGGPAIVDVCLRWLGQRPAT